MLTRITQSIAWAAVLLVLTAALVAPLSVAEEKKYDVLIRNGLLLDGTAAPWRHADVGIVGDRVVSVGYIPPDVKAELLIDAAGRYVTPGFIDPHSHASTGLEAPERASAAPLLWQGITSVYINPDGRPRRATRNHQTQYSRCERDADDRP